MTVAEFLKRFRYRRKAFLGVLSRWRVLDSAPFEGDCNDFALTVHNLAGGGRFWLVKSPKNRFWPRHVALYKPDLGWIDSTRREWRAWPDPHKPILRLPSLWVALRRLPVAAQLALLIVAGSFAWAAIAEPLGLPAFNMWSFLP